MSSNPQALPKVVSEVEWRAARDQALLVEEKKLTRARDALAARRRSLPMTRVETNYTFDDPNGKVSLLDLFEGRPQLLLYHFMFAPGVDGWPSAGCPGCSMSLDDIGQFASCTHQRCAACPSPWCPVHRCRTSRRTGSAWIGTADGSPSLSYNSFNVDFGLTTPDEEKHGYSVFLRDGDDIFRTYFTSERGTEALGQRVVIPRPGAVRPSGKLGSVSRRMAAEPAV